MKYDRGTHPLERQEQPAPIPLGFHRHSWWDSVGRSQGYDTPEQDGRLDELASNFGYWSREQSRIFRTKAGFPDLKFLSVACWDRQLPKRLNRVLCGVAVFDKLDRGFHPSNT